MLPSGVVQWFDVPGLAVTQVKSMCAIGDIGIAGDDLADTTQPGFVVLFSYIKLVSTHGRLFMKKVRTNGHATIHSLTILTCLLACFLLPPSLHAADPRIKVNKHLIKVTPPDNNGVVWITGQAGAIVSTSDFAVQLIDLETNQKLTLTVQPDGSFKVSVRDKEGHKIRILAKNEEKKSSYGTFTIPTSPFPNNAPGTLHVPAAPRRSMQLVPALNVVSTLVTPIPIDAETALQNDPNSVPITIFVNIVDMRTGRLLAYERVDGTLKNDDSNNRPYQETLASFLKNCVSILQWELGKLAENPVKTEMAEPLLPEKSQIPPPPKAISERAD